MSYNLMLVRVPPGVSEDEDVEKVALAASEAERTRRPSPPDAETERRKRAMVEALLEECPELEGGEVDHAALARTDGISEDEARQRYHWWHVTGPEEGAGIQITLYDSYIDIDASRVETDQDWDDLWRYLEILVREGGFVVWDPQGPNVVDLASGPSGDGKRMKRPKPAKRRSGGRSGKKAAERATKGGTGDSGDDRDEGDDGDEGGDDVESEDVRRGGEIAKLINRIIDESITAPLATAGFRRTGRTWRRSVDEGVIQVVNVQWSPRDGGVEAVFWLNAGVYIRALAESIALYAITASPKEYDCQLRRRPGPPGGNGWRVRLPSVENEDPEAKGWFIEFFSWLARRAENKLVEQAARAPREMREALEQHAFPWLERVSTLSGARDELLRGPDMFWAAHASLLLGEREAAARIVEKTLARAKSNPEYSEMVRAWGRTHGLIA